MQFDGDGVFADCTDVRIQMNSLVVDGDAVKRDGIGDHAIRDRTEEMTVVGSLKMKLDRKLFEFGSERFSRFEFLFPLGFDFFL